MKSNQTLLFGRLCLRTSKYLGSSDMKTTLTLRLQPPGINPEQGSDSEQRLPSPSYPALQTQLPRKGVHKISPPIVSTNHPEEGQPARGEPVHG